MCKLSYLITSSYNLLFLVVAAITEEPVTTNTAATAVTIASTGEGGGTDSTSSMATATTVLIPTTGSSEPMGTSTNTAPNLGVLSSLSTTPGAVGASPLNPDMNIAANQETSKRMILLLYNDNLS